MNKENTPLYSEIQAEAKRLGISIAELCRQAGVSRSVLDHWKRKEPQTILIYRKVWGRLNGLAAESDCEELNTPIV